jgi:hypothetical protein
MHKALRIGDFEARMWCRELNTKQGAQCIACEWQAPGLMRKQGMWQRLSSALAKLPATSRTHIRHQETATAFNIGL